MELSHDAAGVYSAQSKQQQKNNNKKLTGFLPRDRQEPRAQADIKQNCRCLPHGRSPVLTCPSHHPSKSWTGRRSRTVARPAKDTRINPNNTRGSISVLVRRQLLFRQTVNRHGKGGGGLTTQEPRDSWGKSREKSSRASCGIARFRPDLIG